MSEIAKAMLVTVDLETGEVMHEGPFVDDGSGMDPAFRAEALWDSIKADWPGHKQHAVVMNEAAADLKAQRMLWTFGMSEPGDPMRERIEAHNARVAA